MARTSTLFTAAVVCMCALSAMAFVPNAGKLAGASVRQVVSRKAATTMKLDLPAVVAGLAPAAFLASPSFAVDVMTSLPSLTVANEVQFPAYLAVLLGVFFPVSFLIVLYIQSEARKAGEASQQQ